MHIYNPSTTFNLSNQIHFHINSNVETLQEFPHSFSPWKEAQNAYKWLLLNPIQHEIHMTLNLSTCSEFCQKTRLSIKRN